jgi:PiT family inorganic phosphate transporter
MAVNAVPVGFEMVVFLVVLALAFDFMNGFHDAANSIATVVSTRVLRPQWAVAWAAFFNFIAFLFFGLSVANTIGKGVIDASIVDVYVILGALTGAIVWNVITWWYGLPSSSSHALIGGLAGAAVAKGGVGALVGTGFLKISLAIVLSPALGFALGIGLMTAVAWLLFRTAPRRVDRWFRRLQLASAALYSLGHGGNDAQKTMGVIALILVAWGSLRPDFKAAEIPFWVVLSCQAAIALGTLFGGWRIVKTMGQKITKLKPVGGFCAETGGALTLFLATGLGIPVSTTHTITGAIIGVGSVNKLSAVRWGVAERIVWAWVLTIPCTAFISALAWWLAQRFL